MTSRDSMASYSWSHNLRSCSILNLGPESTIRVDSLNTHYRTILC